MYFCLWHRGWDADVGNPSCAMLARTYATCSPVWAGRSGQCVTFIAAADEKRFTNLVWLVVDTVRLAFTCQSARADIRTGGSILLGLMCEFHPKLARHGDDSASGKSQHGIPEQKLQRVLALEVQGAWNEAPASMGALFPADMRRRTAKSTLQHLLTARTSTARFQWYQKTTPA